MPDALIVIDMLHTYDHPDGEVLAGAARKALPGIRRAIETARGDGKVIYVNDSFGRWGGQRAALADWVLEEGRCPELVEPLLPEEDDLFIFKPRHTIFYETPLTYILAAEDIDTITLVGQVTEQCVLYSALDAHVRHLHVRVVTDGVAAIDEDLGQAALRMMECNMGAELVRAGSAVNPSRADAPGR